MDPCQYCREYHAPHSICDGYIEAVRQGKVVDRTTEKGRYNYGDKNAENGEVKNENQD